MTTTIATTISQRMTEPRIWAAILSPPLPDGGSSPAVPAAAIRYCFSVFLLIGTIVFDGLESLRLLDQRPLRRQALHRGRAIESVAGSGRADDIFGVRRFRDGAAVNEHDDVSPHPQRRLGPGIDKSRA